MTKNNPILVETNHLIKPSDTSGFSYNRTAHFTTSVTFNWFIFSGIINCKKEWKFHNANAWTSFGEKSRVVFKSEKQNFMEWFTENRTNNSYPALKYVNMKNEQSL